MALKNLDSFCSRLIESILFSIFGQVCVCRVFFSAFILKEEQAVLEFADSLSLLYLISELKQHPLQCSINTMTHSSCLF